MATKLKFSGCMPANLLPFNEDYSIDEKNYRRHLSWLANIPKVTAIVANGHAAEVHALSREERKRTLAIALDEVGDKKPIVAGIFTDGSHEAVQLAKDAEAEGATGLLIFPPSFFNWGAQIRPEMPYRHFSMIAEGVNLPLIIFQYQPSSGVGYTTETLVKLTEIPQVAGIKEFSCDIVAFERNTKAVRETGRPVAILSAYTMALLATFLMGADGCISGLGSVLADFQAELFDLVQKGDLEAAHALNDRLLPLVDTMYLPPFLDMHNRMKEALAILGRIDQAVVRPPLMKISDNERQQIREALKKADITP
jgi:4-hydroxy-tetrahydrodipicolinate synthase